MIEVLHHISLAQYYQGKNDLACESMELGISTNSKHFGDKALMTIRRLGIFKTWLQEWGLDEEAAVIAHRQSRALGPLDIPELLE